MMLKGTQRRLAVTMLALAALSPAAFYVRPASAIPPGDSVSTFNDNLVATTRIAKLNKTITSPTGTFKGGIDRVTGQLDGVMALPPAAFSDQLAGLGGATAQLAQIKPVIGHMNLSTSQVTATSTFILHIVSAYTSVPTVPTPPSMTDRPANPPITIPTITLPSRPTTLPSLPVTLPSLTLPSLPVTLPPATVPPVNMVGNACATAPIHITMRGAARSGVVSKSAGKFTIPKFVSCGTLTALFNKLLSGPGNTFTVVATPASATTHTGPSLPVTVPSLPVTVPSLPVTVPSLG